MGEYCDELDKLNNVEDPFKLNTVNQNHEEENNDLAKAHAEENDDLAKNNAEEKNDVAKNHAEENIYLNKDTAEEYDDMTKDAAEENNDLDQDNVEENIDLDKWPSWGLPPAANPWASCGKPGAPPEPVQPPPLCLYDPIPPGHPRI